MERREGKKLMKCRNGLARPTSRKVGYVERNRHKERERDNRRKGVRVAAAYHLLVERKPFSW